MAYIDKTYTSSWDEYQELVDWAMKNKFTCPNGIKVDIMNSIYPYRKEDWAEGWVPGEERPVMNTSYTDDYFLIKYCPLRLVKDRMTEVYGKEYIDSVLSGKSEFDGYEERIERGRKFRCTRKPKRGYNQNRAFVRYRNGKVKYGKWFVEVWRGETCLWYNEDYDLWVDWNNGELGNGGYSFSNVNTIKALKRKIRKWNLPKGSVVKVTDRCIEDNWEFEVI